MSASHRGLVVVVPDEDPVAVHDDLLLGRRDDDSLRPLPRRLRGNRRHGRSGRPPARRGTGGVGGVGGSPPARRREAAETSSRAASRSVSRTEIFMVPPSREGDGRPAEGFAPDSLSRMRRAGLAALLLLAAAAAARRARRPTGGPSRRRTSGSTTRRPSRPGRSTRPARSRRSTRA